MHPLIRSILAVLAGGVGAVSLIAVVEMLNSVIFPLPFAVDVNDPAAMAEAIAALPVGALVVVLVGWALGSLAGAWLAARLAGRAPIAHGMTVAGLLLLAGVLNMLAIPHPAWMWVLGIAAYLGCGYLGSWLVARRAPGGAAS